MSFIESLEQLKIKISNSSIPINRDYEFETELEDHQLGNQNIYRLYYINYHRIGDYHEKMANNIGSMDYPFKPFMLPDGMNREDGFKVLSYLTDFIEKKQNLKPCSYSSVAILDSVLDLERLGFKRVNADVHIHESDMIDLFTVSGRLLLFKNSRHYSKYFEWYTENITFDEVKEIYKKCNMEFYDLILLENIDETKIENSNDSLQLIKKK